MTNKIILNLLLILTSSFSLFASNTGEECENPYYYGEEELEAQFQEDQQNLYLQFSATNDSMLIEFFSNGDPLEFEKIYLYQFEDCGNLSLIDSAISTNGYPAAYLLSENLGIGVDYMIEIIRFADKTPQLDFLARVSNPLIYPCPTTYNNCMDIVKNGNFDYTSLSAPNHQTAFNDNHVCNWFGYGMGVSLIYKGDNSWYYGSLYNSNPFTELYSVYFNDPQISTEFNDGGIIANEITIQNGKEYNLSFSLRRSSWSSYNKTEIVKAWFINETTLQACPSNMTLHDYLLTLNSSLYQEVGTVFPSQYNSTKTTFKFCKTANNNFNRLIFMTYSTTAGSGYRTNEGAANIDDVSLLHLDVGPDITVPYCGSTTIGPACTIAGATYSWSPTTGLSNPNIANPTVSSLYNSSTTYTLTMTIPNSGSCTVSDQVAVSPSIAGMIFNNADVSDLKDSLNYTVGTTLGPKTYTIFEDYDIFIEGTFTVNENISFRDCNLIMGENAKINIISGELLIEGLDSTRSIRTCDPDKLWDGIYVNPTNLGGSLRIFPEAYSSLDKMQFSNSMNGIVAMNDPKIHIRYVKFDRNNRVLTVEPISNAQNEIEFNFNEIDCSQPILINNVLKYPRTAIWLNNATGGSNQSTFQSITSTGNTFNGKGGKLEVLNSDFLSEGDIFKNFNNHGFYNPNLLVADTAVKITGLNLSSNRKVRIESAVFDNNLNGISSFKSIDLEVAGAIVNFVDSFNVKPVIPNSRFLKVLNNFNDIIVGNPLNPNLIKIYNVQTGIQVNDCKSLNIENVFMDLEYQGAGVTNFTNKTNTNSVGIAYNNFGIDTAYIVFPRIEGNTIKHAKYGILAHNAQIEIKDNTILDMNDNTAANPYCFPNPCPAIDGWGIKTTNSETIITGNKVFNNPSNYYSNPRTNTKVTAIEVVHSSAASSISDAIVNCNTVENTGIGIKFTSAHEPGTQVLNNKMKDHTYGLVLAHNGFVGNIDSSGKAALNQWVGNYGGGSHTFSISSDGSLSPLYVHNVSPYNPAIGPGHRIGSGSIAIAKNIVSSPNAMGCNTRARIRNNTAAPTNTAPGFKSFRNGNSIKGAQPFMVHAIDSAVQFNQQMLFYNLSKDAALMNSPAWKPFADSMRTTPIGKTVGKSLNTAGRGVINIGTPTNFDANLQLINPIAEHFKNGVPLTKLEMTQLYDMAAKCPFYDGIAVYQARAIITSLGGIEIFSTCESVEAIPTTPIGKSNKRLKDLETEQLPFAIYPNPAKDLIFLNFEVGDQENVTFELYDVLGKQQLVKQLNATNTHQVKINAVQPGIYFYRIVSNDAAIESGKLIIE